MMTPGHNVVDLGAGWELSSALELRGTVRNLFNASYPTSPDRRAVLAPGRNAVMTIAADF